MISKYTRIGGLLALLLLAAAGCSGANATQAVEDVPEMTIPVSSPAFAENGAIPEKHTCDGDDVSPPLAWTSLPEGTRSLALITDDPDAPGGTFVHWVIYDLPPDLAGLSEGISQTGSVEGGGLQGTNGFRKNGYHGPCPPKGSTHRYYFKLYALDTMLNLKEGASKADLEKAMIGHILGQGQVVGQYGR
jgi:Raf kinase inhibitor-like YbhB/YbcL family protein